MAQQQYNECPECGAKLRECTYPHIHRMPHMDLPHVRVGHAGHVFGETSEEFFRRMKMEEFTERVRDREIARVRAKNSQW